ncbi:helix-turn-helix transcriptional regulator [Lysinibacillus macroides]|uniref:helix-turn-helix domain-containing protein n=1 Tax=Lysinibacillus macroides TaxID=33935 RepID=UPI0006B4BEA9|nr:AraC family transcriptional regulator [Lysinibacillus macroides]QPR67114.1 helix-turn-helix transcriptional regulator [Lysinibacillus macroides]
MLQLLIQNTWIKVHQHSYWNSIEAFLLDYDTYPYWSFFIVSEGVLGYEFTTAKGLAQFGDIIVCPPQFPLKRKVVERLKFHFFQVELSEMVKLQAGIYKIMDLERLGSTLKTFENYAFQQDDQTNQLKSHYIYDLLVHLVVQKQLIKLEEKKVVSDVMVENVRVYIHQNFHSKINFCELAKENYISQVQLTRRFEKAMGISPMKYLTNIRLRHARTLLVETNDTIDTIATKCGFQNGFYLSKRFREIMYQSPSEFRKQYRM